MQKLFNIPIHPITIVSEIIVFQLVLEPIPVLEGQLRIQTAIVLAAVINNQVIGAVINVIRIHMIPVVIQVQIMAYPIHPAAKAAHTAI